MASGGRRLYVGRIPPDATRTDVEKYFGRYGTLMDVRIMAGFGFLEYDSVRDAEDAVHDLNGRDFMGERLIVEFAKAPRGRDMHPGGGMGGGGGHTGPRRGGFRLLVKGLSHETSWQHVSPAARGPLNLLLATAPVEGSSFTPDLIDIPYLTRILGRTGVERNLLSVLLLCSVWFSTWLRFQQDLKDFARQAGNVTRADVDRNMPGEGLIEYASQDDADCAIRKLDGTELKGMVVTLFEDRPGGGGGGGGRRDRSRSPGYRDTRDRDRSPRDRSRDRERDRSPRERRGGYDRERRRSPPPRDDRERDRGDRGDRGFDRKERERSPRRDV
ncbi:hypothetical protein PSHT_13872 [Puccinia striiformis]|uniref:Uncharacterized protein n=2 Tax=Puccinia striiformis TaxID=27350 RepID=A0A2S4UN60_9BASI|nr:hypothetical protein PSHT_13872 [Puccinia striiformis]POW17069.1 hypothetical protein PSTT_00846 [Puccinia striiformis]